MFWNETGVLNFISVKYPLYSNPI